MKVLQQWMPVQTMKMRGSQEALLLNQSDSSFASSRSSINQFEILNSEKSSHSREMLQNFSTHPAMGMVSTEFSPLPENLDKEDEDQVPITANYVTPTSSNGNKPFVRRFSMQLNSNSLDNLKSFSRRASARRGSIPCIPSPIATTDEPLKSSQTAPNPFPELINSPPSTPNSHGRSQSCIDERTNQKIVDDDYGFVHESSSQTVARDRTGSFCRLTSSPSNSSMSSCNSSTALLPASMSNNYIHSSVIAARAKHILQQHSHSSPSSPAISRRKSNLSDSLVNTNSMVDDSTYASNCYNVMDGKRISPSDSPRGSTGRISPEGMSNLYEQASALWSAQGYTKQMLMVYTDDINYKTVTIEENMAASNVAQLLIDKVNAVADKSWCIIEKLPKFNLERSLEDHELVYTIYRSWSKVESNTFHFQKDFKKYELFNNPAQFLPAHMLDWKDGHHLGPSPKTSPKLSQKSSVMSERHTNLLFQNLLTENDRLPDIQGHLYVKEGRRSWKKHFFVLRNSGLYYSAKGNSKDPKHLVLYSHLSDINIYTAKNSKKVLGSPNNYCICLKPPYCVNDAKELKLLCAEDENSRMCWLAALRLIKYGSQLKDNYKQAVKAEGKGQNGESREKYAVKHYGSNKLNVKSRVAMDFTGHGGRVVDDPNEALGVAIEEGQHWRKKSPRGVRSANALSDSPCQNTGYLSENPNKCTHGLQSGVHMTQPWFHSGITRDEAVELLSNDGMVDGVFLVRESQSMPGYYVLSMAHCGKVKHCTIRSFTSDENEDGEECFSMDGGHTRFLDLVQLIEFYQLNSNGLPTKLTHYITRVL